MNISDILTSNVYSSIVATIAMIVALIAVPASGYFSYKYAIKGEKRKEWNALADPILDYFFMVSREHKNGYFINIHSVPIDLINSISRRFSREELISFTSLFSGYMKILNEVKSNNNMDLEHKNRIGLEASRLVDEIQSIITIK